MSKEKPIYKEGDKLIFFNQNKEYVEIVIIEHTCYDDEYRTWYYKAISTKTDEVVYVEEIHLSKNE